MSEFKEKLTECVENISMDDDIKKRILAINEKSSAHKIERIDQRMKKAKLVRTIASTAAVFVAVASISTIGVKALTGKYLWQTYFQDDKKAEVEELYTDKEQSVSIEDWKITLKEALYDSNVRIGYFTFEIENSNKALQKGDFDTMEFGSKGYSFEASMGGRADVSSKYVDGKEIMTINCAFNDEWDGVYGIYDKVVNTEVPIESMQIETNTVAKDYEAGENKLILSKLGLRILTDDIQLTREDKYEVEFICADGSRVVPSNESRENGLKSTWMTLTDSEYDKDIEVCVIFSDITSIDKVEKVIVNGTEYSIVK